MKWQEFLGGVIIGMAVLVVMALGIGILFGVGKGAVAYVKNLLNIG